MVTDRRTIQSEKIYDYLCSVKSHPTAETIYSAVKKDIPTISLGTVYRNLDKLAKSRKIIRIVLRNETHFDADTSEHQHYVCESCGKIVDLHNPKVSRYAMRMLDSMQASSVSIIYNGKCLECEQNARDVSK